MDAAGGRGDEIDLIEKSEAAALEMALETGKAPGWRSGRQGYLERRNPSRVPLSYFETGARNDVSRHPVGQKNILLVAKGPKPAARFVVRFLL